MRNLEKELKNKTIDYKKLLEYGFVKENNCYIFKNKIYNNQFEMIVEISDNIKASKLIDIENEDEYILVDIEDSTGEFVGKVRNEYESQLQDIINKCTTYNVFKNTQSKQVINYIKEKYNDDLEFLWQKFDDNAVWRNKQNSKWYGLLLTVSKRKLGIDSEEIVEIIDLRYKKGQVDEIVDNIKVYPGYHMNKNTWITIILDGSLEIKTIYDLINNSYNLSIGNKCGITGDKSNI